MIKNLFKNNNKVRKFIKKLIYLFFGFLKIFNKPQPTVLMYHSVSEKPHHLSVPVEIFEEQMKYLVNNKYIFLQSKDLFDIKKYYDKKAVLITFDDALEDVYLNAVPILKKYRIPAIFFVPTGLIGGKFTRPEFNCMTEEQILEISSNEFFEIGSHAISHKKLNYLSDDEVSRELSASKFALEEKVGKLVDSFAAPYGKYDNRVLESLKKFKYQFAFTTYPDNLNCKFSLLEIPRLMIDDTVSVGLFGLFTGGYALYLNFCKWLFK